MNLELKIVRNMIQSRTIRICVLEEDKLQGQHISEPESHYGFKPSPVETSNEIFPLGVAMLQIPKLDEEKLLHLPPKEKEHPLPGRRGLDVVGSPVENHAFTSPNSHGSFQMKRQQETLLSNI
ncbi:hypothetical protein H6P81_014929 [Aristolochia fimbriata]|uniref:Uncharacterized protein n=1 Tax=Aristolochia fimbriata TaxID=158543 RepID=A0AAV7E5W3_ARIFI|nr:hypothetical protein H6P81_014929 [Aristolochia fimbriata]